MILVGDIGATKTLLEVGVLREDGWRPAFGRRYAAIDYSNFEAVLRAFFAEWAAQRQSGVKIAGACFGVAGPAFDNRVQMTNLAWVVDGDSICAEFGVPQVRVVNDFAAAASGIELLQHADLVFLQAGDPIPAAPRVVIGAGTGLGIAYLFWAGDGYQVIAGEAGHAGFAPSTAEQLELWRELHTRYGRVAVERVVSGPGLVRVQEFVERCEGKVRIRCKDASEIKTNCALEGQSCFVDGKDAKCDWGVGCTDAATCENGSRGRPRSRGYGARRSLRRRRYRSQNTAASVGGRISRGVQRQGTSIRRAAEDPGICRHQ